MLTPETRTRRTDDIIAIKWEMGADGQELYNYIVDKLGAGDWEVNLVPWRTISVQHVNGQDGFNVERGEWLAEGDDGKLFRLNDESLKLLFN